MKSSTARAWIGLLASAAFLWALTLSASPALHQRLHSDANRVDHSCAVNPQFNQGSGCGEHGGSPH